MTKSGEAGPSRPRRGKNHILKEAKVIFHGLRYRQDRELIAKVPEAFMEDDLDSKSGLAAHYREMRRHDPNWGANNINMKSLGYVGELCLKANDGFLSGCDQCLGTKDTGTSNKRKKTGSNGSSNTTATSSTVNNIVPEMGKIGNPREFWAWFEAQKYFDYNENLDRLDITALLNTEPELPELVTSASSNNSVKAGAKQRQELKGEAHVNKKRSYSDDDVNASHLVDSLYSEKRGLALNEIMSFGGNGNTHVSKASLGEGVTDSRMYQRLVSAFVIDRREGQRNTAFEPSTLQKVLGDVPRSDATAVNEEVVDISDIPLERRTILEVGAAGLLRDGDNSGDWTSLCREMMSRDSEVSREIKARIKAEKEIHQKVNMLLKNAKNKLAREFVEQKYRNSSKEKQQISNYLKRF